MTGIGPHSDGWTSTVTSTIDAKRSGCVQAVMAAFQAPSDRPAACNASRSTQ